MKIGLMLAVHEWEDKSLQHTIAYAVQAEQLGFDCVYVPNTIGADALTLMTLIGQATTAIQLNSAVVPIQTRHPFAMAQQALTMAAATPGRLSLSVGLSHKLFIEPFFGLSYDKPAQQMEEYLQVMMPLINERAVSFEGEFHSSGAALDIAEAAPIPVMVAALGPRMLELTGRLTDGSSLWMTGPETISNYVLPIIAEAADKAGRVSPKIIAGVPVVVTEDIDAARQKLDEKLGMYDMLPSYRSMLDREGLASPTDMAIVGSEQEVLEKLAGYREAGATDLNVNVISIDEPTTQRTLACLQQLL